MKRVISFTVDEELINWMNSQSDFKSASEFINELIKEAREHSKDQWKVIQEASQEIIRAEKKMQDALIWVKTQADEGNKKEREMAEKALKEEQERMYVHKERLKFCIGRLAELNLEESAKKCTNMDECMELAKKIMDITIKQKRPFSETVGAIDIFRLNNLELK